MELEYYLQCSVTYLAHSNFITANNCQHDLDYYCYAERVPGARERPNNDHLLLYNSHIYYHMDRGPG